MNTATMSGINAREMRRRGEQISFVEFETRMTTVEWITSEIVYTRTVTYTKVDEHRPISRD